MEDFQINYTDINNLFWEYKTNLENLMNKIDYCEWCINQFIENAVFTGSTADALKSYLTDVHITMLSSLRVTAQNLLDNMTLYKAGYYDIDNSTNFKLSEEAIREFRTKSSTNYSDTESYTGKIQGAVSGISDISGVGTPSSNGALELHEQLDQELLNFITTIQNQESSTVTALENSVDLLISSLNSCIAKVGLNQGAIASYESNSFYTDKDVYTLANISQVFYQQHEDNKDVYEAMLEVEQNLKDAVQERETQGIWKIVGVAVLIATGAACIVLTGGAATPIVADVAVAAGSGTAVFGAADAIEGTQDIYYGSTGDIDSTAVNGIKDDLFQGNEDAYYLTENAFAFAASAMIPIGQASTAGNLTFKSTATIVAKEGISMGAGAGAQKITTDVTGNDTAGMVAGMVASGVTAKGLNGIEAKAGKLGIPKLADGGVSVGGKSGKTTIKFKEVKTFTAEETNQWFIDNVKPDYKPPYKPGTLVKEIELTENTTFVRVYDNMPDGSGMYGSWVMRAYDIEGLTTLEIQNKFALPNTPKYVCDVELEAGTHIRVGEVNPLDGWGNGGGTQYDLIGQRIGDFKNERLLEGKINVSIR